MDPPLKSFHPPVKKQMEVGRVCIPTCDLRNMETMVGAPTRQMQAMARAYHSNHSVELVLTFADSEYVLLQPLDARRNRDMLGIYCRPTACAWKL